MIKQQIELMVLDRLRKWLIFKGYSHFAVLLDEFETEIFDADNM
jgi:hypothetical protein